MLIWYADSHMTGSRCMIRWLFVRLSGSQSRSHRAHDRVLILLLFVLPFPFFQ